MKRLISALLCAALLTGLFLLPGLSAPDASNLIFTVIDQRLMSVRTGSAEYVEADKLSFYSGNTYYVWANFFRELSVINEVSHNEKQQTVTLFNISQSLFFDYSNNITWDKKGEFYDYAAIWRNGQIFLPLEAVKKAFGLVVYHAPESAGSSTPIPAPILYIASEKPSGEAGAALDWGQKQSSRLVAIKSRYIAALTEAEQQPDPVVPTTEPQQPPKLVYFTFEGPLDPDRTPAILQSLSETLSSTAVKAAFFIPADRESILGSADLLRRLYAEGHTIGLLLEGEQTDPQTAVDTFEAGNALLRQVIFTKTRLVCLESGTAATPETVLDALTDQGCRLWDSNVLPDPSGGGSTRSLPTAVRNSISRASGTAVIRLDSSQAVADMLASLITYIDSGNYSLLTVTDWDTPVNQAQVLQ